MDPHPKQPGHFLLARVPGPIAGTAAKLLPGTTSWGQVGRWCAVQGVQNLGCGLAGAQCRAEAGHRVGLRLWLWVALKPAVPGVPRIAPAGFLLCIAALMCLGGWAGIEAAPHPSCPPRKQVLGTKVDAERDGVKVPTTLAEYCVKTKAPAPEEGADLFYEDYYEDGEVEEADSCFGDDEDDSGTEES